MRRNPIVLAFNIVCLLQKINRKTLEFKLAELPMGGRDAAPPLSRIGQILGIQNIDS